jgi:hypothetical protein
MEKHVRLSKFLEESMNEPRRSPELFQGLMYNLVSHRIEGPANVSLDNDNVVVPHTAFSNKSFKLSVISATCRPGLKSVAAVLRGRAWASSKQTKIEQNHF